MARSGAGCAGIAGRFKNQFHFLEQTTLDFLKGGDYSKGCYNVTGEELEEIRASGDLEAELENVENNVQQSKKLLRKCYEGCRELLPKD